MRCTKEEHAQILNAARDISLCAERIHFEAIRAAINRRGGEFPLTSFYPLDMWTFEIEADHVLRTLDRRMVDDINERRRAW